MHIQLFGKNTEKKAECYTAITTFIDPFKIGNIAIIILSVKVLSIF